MRAGGFERLMVFLGASGAGKSSFLGAGLLSRLERDEEHFLVLPVVRPTAAGPSELFRALELKEKLTTDALQQLFTNLRAPVVKLFESLAKAEKADYRQKPPTIILPIDPGEELFNSEHEKFIEEFKALDNVLRADANLIVIITLRSDGFAKLQNSPEFSEIARVPFDLPRLSPSAFKEAIEGPGRLGDPPIQFEPALIDKLTADLNTPDALPLLAFTLQRLIASPADDGLITLNDYEAVSVA